MDGLRWLLLLSGLLVVAGVYFYSRRERAKEEEQESSPERLEPALGDESLAPPADAESAGATDDEDAEDAVAEQKIVTVRLVARDKGTFRGDQLVLSLRGIGMRHGKFGIFHRYEGTDEDDVVFSVASLAEPGTFNLPNIKEQRIPGISMFMVLPGPMGGAESFDLMMTAARALSQALHAELLDESGSTLSIQRERYLREEIIQYEHGISVA
ncbi:MAG: cell division protein ZipA C-terminal FtsZ-binding domain-containing protein [Proteobacteria bacterium]|nr:cell division protein ZipA C-terminal FtsZ-binding domain-containing protein [Pseudomonadota bacterium]